MHGEFAYKDSDVNSTYGAWWVPLRRMVKELGTYMCDTMYPLYNTVDTVCISLWSRYRADTIPDTIVSTAQPHFCLFYVFFQSNRFDLEIDIFIFPCGRYGLIRRCRSFSVQLGLFCIERPHPSGIVSFF